MLKTMMIAAAVGCVVLPGAQAADRSLLKDLTLTQGFRLSALRSSMTPVEVGVVMAADTRRPPKWRLAQWGVRHSLENASEKTLDNGARVLGDDGKTVIIHPGGLAGDGLTLAMDSSREYGAALRQHGEAWPHLLIEQAIPEAPLREMRALKFRVAFNVERCVPDSDQPLDPGLHTAHITAFWTIHNKNEQSPDHNDMIWFGLPLYDVRYPVPPGHQALDKGQDDATGKFICTIEGARFYSEPVTTGHWHVLACDMLPLVREALAAAQNQGFLVESDLHDLAITSFNLGWEMPGPYDCVIHLRELALLPEHK